MQNRNAAFSVFQRSAQLAQAHGCSRDRKVVRAHQYFQFAEGSFTGSIRRCGVDPKRRSRGAIGARAGARATDFGRVVRLTGGLLQEAA